MNRARLAFVAVLVVAAALAAWLALGLDAGRPPSALDRREGAGSAPPSLRTVPSSDPDPVAVTTPPADASAGGDARTRAAPVAGAAVVAAPAPLASDRVGSEGSIRGRAALPPDLRASADRMELHVTRSVEWIDGSATESFTVAGSLGPDGQYVLSGLPPGRYAVQVVGSGAALSETRRLSLAPGEHVRGVDFRFVREVAVEGRVRSAVHGRPVRDAVVRLRGEPPGTTDSGGRFVLYDLPPGTYDLVVAHEDHAPARVEVRVPERGAASALALELDPGAEARVRAMDSSGKPKASVPVIVSTPTHTTSAVTDERGTALVRGLSAGERYSVRIAGSPAPSEGVSVVPEFDEVVEVTVVLSD